VTIPSRARLAPLTSATSDVDLVALCVEGDRAGFETLMRRYNSRLFRVARSILKDDAQAEDALQDAYLRAYRQIRDFRGTAQVSTWLTRIVINQALMIVRKRKRDAVLVAFEERRSPDDREREMPDTTGESPSDAVLRAETRRLLERRIDELPLTFRTVFVMREVQEMTVEETAACLDIPEATVRSRLFRARALLRASLARDMDIATSGAFRFDGARCDRIVAAVLKKMMPGVVLLKT
jgi:RNA polymerase sigma-70 factor (ECF subfamily)